MKAWADLTGRCLSVVEVQALRRIDSAFLAIMNRKDDDG